MASGATREASKSGAFYPPFTAADSESVAAARAAAFASVSPRVSGRRAPFHVYPIYAGVFALWFGLTCMAFLSQSLLAWSVGIAYVGYDTLLILFVASRLAPLLRAAPHPAAAETTAAPHRPSIAVIVAAWNEASALPRTLDALFAQDDRPDVVVIADDGSDDATDAALFARYGLVRTAVGELSARSPAHALHWLRLPHRGKAVALNAALAHIETDIVVTVDADTILAPDAIAVIRASFAADEKLVVGGGVLIPMCDATVSGRVLEFFQRYEYIRNFMSRYAWARLDALLLISGAFAAFRREPLMQVGGFDPESLVEDYELIHRLQRQSREQRLGWRVRVLGRARAITGAPGRVRAFLRQRRRWFAGFLQTQYWNRDMTGTPSFGALGLAMMPVKAIDTLQPIYGLTALTLLAAFLLTGNSGLAVPVFGVMTAKIVLDLAFYLVCIALYRRWTGDRTTRAGLHALGAAIVEPLTFQPLRHAGAAWGWISLLGGNLRWGRASRAAG